jgi:MFS family permease
MGNSSKPQNKKVITASFLFIVLMALVSMLSDMTHEGANSMNGAFEQALGASSLTISVVGGCATLLGCGLRFLTGYLADRTKHYWTFTIVGYAIDLVAVPLLALVPNNGWIWAISFILLEKVGKAVKKPAKDTLVSFAATQNGVGKSFAFGEVLDQIGATIGPMILTLTYYLRGDNDDPIDKMRIGFAVLGIPALICMGLLIFAFFQFPHPEAFERAEPSDAKKNFFKQPAFVFFILASVFLALGFLDSFSLLNVRINSLGVVSQDNLPLLYSYAMLIDALAALVFGLLYDKIGFLSIAVATFLTAGYSFFIFLMDSLWSVFIGLTLWGIGMGAEESVMKSGVTTLSGKEQRARAFGYYELFYGLAAFGGSFLLGWLYDVSPIGLCLVSAISIGLASLVYLYSDWIRRRALAGVKTPLGKPDPLAKVKELNAQGSKSEAMAELERLKRDGEITLADYQEGYSLVNKEMK